MPCVNALLLDVQRNQQLIGMGIALHQSDALQRVQFAVEQCEVVEGFFHRASLAGEVFDLVAGISLVAEQVL